MIPGPKAHLPGPFSHPECAVGALSFYVLASHAHSATQKATPVACSMYPCTGHFSILASVFFPVKWVSQAPSSPTKDDCACNLGLTHLFIGDYHVPAGGGSRK